jgi:rare lipoprotein A
LEVKLGFAKRLLTPSGIATLGEAETSARIRLSWRDNGENPLEFRFPSANTHRRQNLIAELQVDVKLTHTEGECVVLRLSRLLWVVLLACAFLALGSGCAEAREGLASWYGPGFKGLPTASGEPYNPQGYTAAHKTLPLGSDLVVSYGGNSVGVTVNDRGPYVAGRELDLSRAAARDLGLTRVGVDYVEYNYAGGVSYDTGYSTYSGTTDYSTYASTDQSGGGTYVVQQGDTLSGIAAQLGTTVEDLAASNGIANPDFVYAGQTLHY